MPREHQDQAGVREPGPAGAWGAVLCSGHAGFALGPAGGAAKGWGGWVPSPGRAPPGPLRGRRGPGTGGAVLVGRRGCRCMSLGAGGSSAPRGQGLFACLGGSPCGQWLLVGAGGALGGPTVPVPAAHPKPGPGRSVPCVWGGGSGRCCGPAQTLLALVRCQPWPVWGCWLSVWATAAVQGEGVFSQILALARSPGEKWDVSGVPSPSLPPLLSWVRGTGEPLSKAPARGRAELPVSGRQQGLPGQHLRGSLGRAMRCRRELRLPHISPCAAMDRRTEEPQPRQEPHGVRSPRKKPGCLRRGRRCCLPSLLAGDDPACACPETLWGQVSCLGPRLFVRAPVSFWSSSFQPQLSFGSCTSFSAPVSGPAPAHFHAGLWTAPAQFWLQLVDGSSSSSLPVPACSGSSCSEAPACAC